MNLKRGVKKMFQRTGYTIRKMEAPDEAVYDQDGLRSMHDHDFMKDPAFLAAYDAGSRAQGKAKPIHWRLHTILWAARHASRLAGDFVECGVYKGFFSMAVVHYLDWNRAMKGRKFYLLDTFQGQVLSQLNEKERTANPQVTARAGTGVQYEDIYESVRRNFAPFEGVRVVRGAVPGSLSEIESRRIAYVSIDMNCAEPELRAAEFLWERMVPGAVCVLDDYAYHGYTEQKKVMDAFALARNISILGLPTGQGIYLKP